MSNTDKNDASQKDFKCVTVFKKEPEYNATHPLRYYEFTNDEIRTLEECDRESFYQRCLPISTMLATTTYYGIRWRYLGRNPHFGAVPKVLVSIIIGHIMGRLSYIPHCEAKLRRLPANSYLGKVMRDNHMARNPPEPKKK